MTSSAAREEAVRTLLAIWVPGKPATKGSKRAFVTRPKPGSGKQPRAVMVEDAKESLSAWMSKITTIASAAYDHPPHEGALAMTVTFHMPRPKGHYGTGRNADTLKPVAPTRPTGKPDLDKMLRAVKDALEGVVYRNDSQIVDVAARKVYGDPGATIEVCTL